MTAGEGRILVVCAANVCRSPMAELSLRQAFSDAGAGFAGVEVSSAGISAMAEWPVCVEVRDFDGGPGWGALADAHRSRPLEPEDALAASLVLAASREIRAAVVAAAPASRRRVFTLREAAWLGAGYRGDEGPQGAWAVEAFARHIDGRRGLRPLPAARRTGLARRLQDPVDIADAHHSRAGVHRSTVRAVRSAADEIAALITGSR